MLQHDWRREQSTNIQRPMRLCASLHKAYCIKCVNNWLKSSLKQCTILFFSIMVFVQQILRNLATWQATGWPPPTHPTPPSNPTPTRFQKYSYSPHTALCWPHAKTQQWSLLGEIFSMLADCCPCIDHLTHTHTQLDVSSHQKDGGRTSISCTCSSLVMYICCNESSSSLLRSRRVFPSSAAKCRSERKQTKTRRHEGTVNIKGNRGSCSRLWKHKIWSSMILKFTTSSTLCF